MQLKLFIEEENSKELEQNYNNSVKAFYGGKTVGFYPSELFGKIKLSKEFKQSLKKK